MEDHVSILVGKELRSHSGFYALPISLVHVHVAKGIKLDWTLKQNMA